MESFHSDKNTSSLSLSTYHCCMFLTSSRRRKTREREILIVVTEKRQLGNASNGLFSKYWRSARSLNSTSRWNKETSTMANGWHRWQRVDLTCTRVWEKKSIDSEKNRHVRLDSTDEWRISMIDDAWRSSSSREKQRTSRLLSLIDMCIEDRLSHSPGNGDRFPAPILKSFNKHMIVYTDVMMTWTMLRSALQWLLWPFSISYRRIKLSTMHRKRILISLQLPNWSITPLTQTCWQHTNESERERERNSISVRVTAERKRPFSLPRLLRPRRQKDSFWCHRETEYIWWWWWWWLTVNIGW